MLTINRRTRWAQFLLLTLSYILFLAGGLAWLYYSDYEWWVELILVVCGIVAFVSLIILTYDWLLAWKIEWDNRNVGS